MHPLPPGCGAEITVGAREYCRFHEERCSEMHCVVASQRLALSELRCTLDEFRSHLDEVEIGNELCQFLLSNAQLFTR